MFEDLIVELAPPPNRQGKCIGEKERHLTEAAVMLAYGMHLLRTIPGLTRVELHPDGEHAKRFEIVQWLNARGFLLKESHGTTAWCGTYASDKQLIVVTSIPGKGDVVASTSAGVILAECKGGIVNTRHPGQVSRLRKGLCEAVGLLMATSQTGRQVAVVPHTETTLRLAQRMASRAKSAGIEIALVNEFGQVIEVDSTAE
ncbi:MAG: hypothetical protein WAL34_00635 [Acidobacteriaceae bacterium]